MMREVPATKEATLYCGAGRWYQRREAAYYAIAKKLIAKRFPRWLDDPASDGPYIDDRSRTLGSVLAEGECIPDWEARRARMWDLLWTFESGGGHFDPDKWRRVCRRLAKFLAFVDRRRAVLVERVARDAAKAADRLIICEERMPDGRRCTKPASHRPGDHFFEGIPGQNCTCMLRWYPNRCTAHPEMNQ